MTILYNIASRNRPKELFETLDNLAEMSNNKFLTVIKLDSDDPRIHEYIEGLKGYGWVDIIIGQSKSKIDAINRDIPFEQTGWSILVNLSDDQRFTVKGFDDLIRQHCTPDTFLHLPDSYKRAACSTMSIMGRAYYERTRYIYNTAYYSLWCDVEATEVAKLLGCYKYLPNVVHQHLHYSNGKAEMDDLYRRNNTYKLDRATYLQRRSNNFGLNQPRDPYLLIKYPTFGRWKMFFAAIDNIYATIRTNQFKILVSANIDDVEMNCAEVREFCKRYHNVEIHYGNHKNKIAAVNADFNPLTRWNWMCLMSDDMTFVEPGWDYKMLEDVRTVWPDGWDWFAHFNDSYIGDQLPTMNIVGREYYNRTGYVYHPAYKSVSCDAEEMFRAQMLGRYHYFDTIYFEHRHPANTSEPSDYVYRKNHGYGAEDTIVYFERLKRLFDVENPVMIPEEMKPYL